MTKLESAKEIVKQRGGCIDIQCSDCCLSPSNCGDSVNCLHLAKEYLEKHRAKNKMTKLESAKIIVKQGGSCANIECGECCLVSNCDDVNLANNFKLAKEYLEKHTPKNKITKLKSAKMIVEQDGACVGIGCSECCLINKCSDLDSTLQLAKKFIEKHETKSMVLVSNDKINWKERKLVMVYDEHYLCKTKDDGYKIWKYKKEIPNTEIWYQYLFKTTKGDYAITPIIPFKSADKKRYIRVDESAKEVKI